MIIHGEPVSEVKKIQKSISNNLRNKNLFQSENKDTADTSIRLKPPISMNDCLFVFENSSYVAKCCRILAADIIYNDITLTYADNDNPNEHEINQLRKINEYLNNNKDELYNLAVDYNYAGWCAMEYAWNNTSFTLQQIPIYSCDIIRVNVNGEDLYLLEQKINSTTKHFKIMGESYPDNFMHYNNNPLGYASLIGGDNIYQFFSLPKWIQDYQKILTEIAITSINYRTVSNGNISSGVLNINLEPQTAKPIRYDGNGQIIQEKTREETITEELQSANGGTAVIFTESNRPMNMDYVGLANNNSSYLTELGLNCQQSVLNDYNIPMTRMMINTEKESMNSDKTKSIWEIYTLNLKNEQTPYKLFIKELLKELYSIHVDVDISLPIFSDRREIETGLLSKAWNDGALTLQQFIVGLSEYLNVVDLNDYDFTKNPEIWSYRKIPELTSGLSVEDAALIDEIEAQLNETKS